MKCFPNIIKLIALHIKSAMGYNSKCQIQNCKENCCNYYGYCPQLSSSSTYLAQCWNYYNVEAGTHQLSTGLIVGIALASAFGVVVLVLLIRKIYQKCKIYHNYETGSINQQITTTQNETEYKEQPNMNVSIAKWNINSNNNSTQPPTVDALPQVDTTAPVSSGPNKLNNDIIPIPLKQFPQNPLSFIYTEQ